MKIIIKQCGEEKISKSFEGTVKSLLANLDINPETVLVVKNGELLQLGDFVSDNDIVEILSVVSGG